MSMLDNFRSNCECWGEVAFQGLECDGEGFDSNQMNRHALLVAIQYDFQESDKDLIAYLFLQEIEARENESTGGMDDSLSLSAYLLARFRDPSHIPFFCRAKYANFDTFAGAFDTEYIFFSLGNRTESYVLERFPELAEKIEGIQEHYGDAERLDNWWESTCKRFPDSEQKEDSYTLYSRYLYFKDKNRAKEHLERWNSQEPESDTKDRGLIYAYKALGELSKAADLIKNKLPKRENNWDRASEYSDLLELYIKLGWHSEGFECIKNIGEVFRKFDDWKRTGLGRIIIQRTFEYAIASQMNDLSLLAFNMAYEWSKEATSISLVALEAGWAAAEKCQLPACAAEFREAAKKEHVRIYGSQNPEGAHVGEYYRTLASGRLG